MQCQIRDNDESCQSPQFTNPRAARSGHRDQLCGARAAALQMVPIMDQNELSDPAGERAVSDAIVAFGIRSAIAGDRETMRNLINILTRDSSGPIVGKHVIDCWNDKPTSIAELEQTAISVVKAIHRSEHVDPYRFWTAGLRFFEWINRSRFGRVLTVRLADWQRAGWERVLRQESFHCRGRRSDSCAAVSADTPDYGRIG